MPSPFPGMNPYLEQAGVWEMFHTQMISTLQQQLTTLLRPRYHVQIDTRIYLHEPSAEERKLIGLADVGISSRRLKTRTTTLAAASPATAVGSLPSGIITQKVHYLVIRDRLGREVVTAIELLSPSNKRHGPDREQYLGKRWEIVNSNAHFVELDLLRGFQRLPLVGLPSSDYSAIVSRCEERPDVNIWDWSVREPLPSIPVPLKLGEPDTVLDLKKALDTVYDLGGYSEDI